MSYACKNDEFLQHILLDAFMTCCIDNRRLPFFAAYVSSEDSFLDDSEGKEQNNAVVTGSMRLMLFLEVVSFRDLFGVTPIQRRVYAAERIAQKFLLPQKQDESDQTTNPQFDMRSMFAPDVINTIEESINKNEIRYDLFYTIEHCLKKSFGGMKFASFLLSDECARMRAYMRGTSPYQDPTLEYLFKDALDPNSTSYVDARNHLQYIIIYLLCQAENDVLDKNYKNKIETDSINTDVRVMGSAGGICCAIFIKRVLMPAINKAKDLLLQNQINDMDMVGQALIDSYSSLWEYFIAPSGGSLEFTPLFNDTQLMLDKVRRSVSLAASPPKNFSPEEKRRHMIRSLALNTDLSKSLQKLGEELLYDYSVNAHPKYRGHTIHEWMCAEASKCAQKNAVTISEENTDVTPPSTEVQKIPKLSSTCISRLLRRLEFPEGLSRHCPEFNSKIIQQHEKQESKARCNADFAVVFGSDYQMKVIEEGDESDEKTDKATASHELQRFACVPLSSRGKAQLSASQAQGSTLIPPTLESYVHVPLSSERQFQHITDSCRFT